MYIVSKKWGQERWIRNDEKYCMKELLVIPGFRCSLHMHKIKTETFYVVSGMVKMFVQSGDKPKEVVMCPGQTVHIEPGCYHRFESVCPSILLECSTQHFEDDSYRREPSCTV